VRTISKWCALALVACVTPSAAAAQLVVSGRAASVRVGGLMQSQYTVSSINAANNDFYVRRARLRMDATVSDFLRGRVVSEFGGGSGVILDADVSLVFSDAFVFSFGQFKRAFDLFELPNPSELPEIERDGRIEGYSACSGVGSVCSYSRLTEGLQFAGRDIGVRIDGTSGRLTYVASITNGPGLNVSDENDAKSFSGRLAYAVNEDVVVAGQIAVHDYVDANGNSSALGYGGDVEVGDELDGWHLRGAIAGGENWRDLDVATLDPASFLTFQGIATYYYPLTGGHFAGVEPLARLSWADPDTGTDNDSGLLLTPGVALYISGRNRLAANIDIYSPQGQDKEFSLKLQSTLYF
jgi:Phosphate-selective porin O and P